MTALTGLSPHSPLAPLAPLAPRAPRVPSRVPSGGSAPPKSRRTRHAHATVAPKATAAVSEGIVDREREAAADPSPIEEVLTVSDPQLLLDAFARGEEGVPPPRQKDRALPAILSSPETPPPAAPASAPASSGAPASERAPDKAPTVTLREDEQALRTANGGFVIRRRRTPAAA
jgi:hypothetical protein